MEHWKAIVTGVVATVVGAEAFIWLPRLSGAIVRRAARLLSHNDHQRYEEEWLAYLAEMPPGMVQFAHALGFLKVGISFSIHRSVVRTKLAVLGASVTWFLRFSGWFIDGLSPKLVDRGDAQFWRTLRRLKHYARFTDSALRTLNLLGVLNEQTTATLSCRAGQYFRAKTEERTVRYTELRRDVLEKLKEMKDSLAEMADLAKQLEAIRH